MGCSSLGPSTWYLSPPCKYPVEPSLSAPYLLDSNFSEEFSDGIQLTKLVEQFAGRVVAPNKKRTTFAGVKINNVALLNAFLLSEGSQAIGYDSSGSFSLMPDVAAGKPKALLSLLWAISARYEVGGAGVRPGDIKKNMLSWVREKTGTDVKDFVKSWRDGTALTAVIGSLTGQPVPVSPRPTNKQSRAQWKRDNLDKVPYLLPPGARSSSSILARLTFAVEGRFSVRVTGRAIRHDLPRSAQGCRSLIHTTNSFSCAHPQKNFLGEAASSPQIFRYGCQSRSITAALSLPGTLTTASSSTNPCSRACKRARG